MAGLRNKKAVMTVNKAELLNEEDKAPEDVVRVFNKSLAKVGGRNSYVKLTNRATGQSIIVRVWGTPKAYKSAADGKVFMHYDQLSELGGQLGAPLDCVGSKASLKDVMNYQVRQGDMTALATKWSAISAIGAVGACVISAMSIVVSVLL